MRSLLSQAEQPESRPSFLSRQFTATRTTKQMVFDIIFGIAAPVLCFLADPIVFKGGFMIGEPVLGRYQLFAYLFSAVAIAVLVIWLFLEQYLEPYSSLIGGVFMGGTLFSTVVGLMILPVSFFGLVLLIGVAGFTPFLTAFVYFRNAVKAFRRSRHTRVELKTAGALLAASIAIGVPAIISFQVELTVSQSVEQLLNGDALQAQAAADRLAWLPVVPDHSLQSVVLAYRREQDAKKKQVLKKYYHDVTGQDIDWRLRMLDD